MCGICGIWNTDGRPVDLGALYRTTNAIRHRGPDDEGYLLVDTRSGRTALCGGEHSAPELGLPDLRQFAGQSFDLALGFRRLAILDLSPAGHQPMASADKSCWLVFNGEVYNYLELREELIVKGYAFHTGCDSEVILAAYQEWGVECLQRFNGMWSLALWDNNKKRLFVARDRLGVKPFYSTAPGETTFAFASEIKSLLAGGWAEFKPDAAAISRYVAQGVLPSHRVGDTMFQGVREMPAAHYAVVTDANWQARRFWQLPTDPPKPDTGRVALQHYSELFTDAVRLRLRADVAIGTCLSGGVDSSSIVAVAGRLMQSEHAIALERLGEHQQTFSAVYDQAGRWDERVYMDQVLERTGAAGNFVKPTAQRLWDDLEQLVWHQDEPFQSTSIFAQWCVMGLARQKGMTVLLDGQGADEVLGGYRPFTALLSGMIRAGQLRRALRTAGEIQALTGLSQKTLLARALMVQLPDPALAKLRDRRLASALSGSALRPDLQSDLIVQLTQEPSPYIDLRDLEQHLSREILEDSLPNLLRYEDRNSMAFSIEARVPFLDYRLVEYAFGGARTWRIRQGWTKWVQRKTVERLLPESIVWRRDKVGFETPAQQWLREGQDRLLDILSPESPASVYIDIDAARRATPQLLEQPGGDLQVWRWANLALWLQVFGDKTRFAAAPDSMALASNA